MSVRSKDSLEKHIETHKATGPITFKCGKCDKTFPSRASLKIHAVKKHAEYKFSCEKCNLKYHKKPAYNKHMANVHSKESEKTFVCEYCDKTFYMQRLLNSHKSKVHNVAEFRCDDCNKNFKSKVGLIRHCIAIHNGEFFSLNSHNVEITQIYLHSFFHLQKIPQKNTLGKYRKVIIALNVQKNSIPN